MMNVHCDFYSWFFFIQNALSEMMKLCSIKLPNSWPRLFVITACWCPSASRHNYKSWFYWQEWVYIYIYYIYIHIYIYIYLYCIAPYIGSYDRYLGSVDNYWIWYHLPHFLLHALVPHMHEWTGSALVQIMACRLFGTITWTNIGLSIGPRGTNFSEIWIKIKLFIHGMHLKMLSVKWWPFCSGGNELRGVDFLVTLKAKQTWLNFGDIFKCISLNQSIIGHWSW